MASMSSPKTAAEARAYRYGAWAGEPNGRRYDPARCAAVVWSGGRGSMAHQCGRAPSAGIFCQAHAPHSGPTSTWYRCDKYSTKPEPVEAQSFTEHTVVIGGRRQQRETSYEMYFPTMEQAVAHLRERCAIRVKHLEFELGRARKDLAKVDAMAKP